MEGSNDGKEEGAREEMVEEEKEKEEYDMDNKFFHYRLITNFANIPPNTIDDGVCDALGREFVSMGYKFSFALWPWAKGAENLKSWDLWGPFFMCLVFGIFINSNWLLR